MHDDKMTKAYQDFVNAANREPPDNEYAVLAAYDALTSEYNLDRYPTPPA